MNLMASASTSTFTFAVPTWVLWGVGLAVVVTALLLGIVWLFASVWGALAGDWLPNVTKPKLGAVISGFATYGLLPGLFTTWMWSNGHRIGAVLGGLVVFACVWALWTVYERQNSSY